MRSRLGGLAFAALAAQPVHAEAPLSAIDWLSESVTDPESAPIAADTVSGIDSGITVTLLDAPRADAAGLLAPSVTGLPRALWGPATVTEASDLIMAAPRMLSPGLSSLKSKILLAETDAPAAPDGLEDALLLARVDTLLDMGALDQAGALLNRAGIGTPDRFRRYFDIALLQGYEQEACSRLRERPDIAPTYPARIFCLARGGDWSAAAVTLETANSLGILSPAEDLLLARFLDAEIIGDGLPDQPPVTPLTFRISEAIGEPIPTDTLPLAFAWADLRPNRGWKTQIGAAERLVRHGALSPNQLFGLYLRMRPSASGGVWERVAAVQAFDSALNSGKAPRLGERLEKVWDEMRAAGLHLAFARQYGGQVASLDLEDNARNIALSMGLLSTEAFRVALTAETSRPRQAFLIALAGNNPAMAPATDPVSQAVRDGFLAADVGENTARLLREGRVAEALFRAISQFHDASAGDLDGIADAIATLRALDQEDVALRASLELLLSQEVG